MEDGINFLSQMIAYAGLGANARTLTDDTEPAPAGTDALVRHLVFLRRTPERSVSDFRTWVEESLAPALAAMPEVRKVRRHLFEEMTKPLERQYQATIEVVVDDEAALASMAASPAWATLAGEVADRCDAMHAARVTRCITTKHDGAITLAGARGVRVADVIRRLHATSQTMPDVAREFLPPSDLDRTT